MALNPPRPARVVLTGGIGSGKSSARDAFARLGIWSVDADDLSHELTGPGGDAMPAIVARWGPQMADGRGALQRQAMRDLIFRDPTAREVLESIVHPKVAELADLRLSSPPSRADGSAYAHPYVLYVVPLWFETRGFERPPGIASVGALDLEESLQWQRVMAREADRGMTPEVLRGILQRQVSRAQRRAAADWLLSNDGTPQDLEQAVALRHAALSKSLRGHG